jgi:GT2 family glycosyltransferase/peptidoglycan/xylan/chitin deacetylase (PgdA/CDA1 family)
LTAVRLSVVIPTHQRRELVLDAVKALTRQQFSGFEVVVSVDGSTDGSASALRQLRTPFPLSVVEHANQGAAMARNRGAQAAKGELLLFLDDDMEPDPALLAEHDRSHRLGADLVLGHIPLHPSSPPTPIAAVTGRWAERRRRRLEATEQEVPVADVLTGQMSISRAAFERLGGFDPSFTRGGLFGGEDLDFGIRAKQAGLRVAFNPAAVSHQVYDIDATTYTRRSRDVGRSDQELGGRYPQLAEELTHRRRFRDRGERWVFGTLAAAPRPLSWPLRALATAVFSRPARIRGANRLFFAVQAMEYARGRREALRRQQHPKVVVLAYHAIADLDGDRILGPYGVPPARFASQLDGMLRAGWRFVSLQEVLSVLDGRGSLPSRAVLVTFDDGFADLLTAALPIMVRRGVPAVAFAVSDRLGATNDWESRSGVSRLALLDAHGLGQLSDSGVAIGSHGATHCRLPGLDGGQLEAQVGESAARLQALGLPRPAAFSYPYGEWSPNVVAAVRAAGYAAAFTVTPGAVRRGVNRYALPRVEVFATDTPRTVLCKLVSAGWPDPLRRWALTLLPGPGR